MVSGISFKDHLVLNVLDMMTRDHALRRRRHLSQSLLKDANASSSMIHTGPSRRLQNPDFGLCVWTMKVSRAFGNTKRYSS